MNIFVTGTKNGVGKTFISAGLAALMQSLGYKSGVYKPFQCGAEVKNAFLIAPDLAFVKKTDSFLETNCSYLMKTQAVPALAAEIEKTNIDINTIIKDYKLLNEKCELVITEGAFGLNAPISSKMYMGDVAKLLKLPIVIIARPDSDMLNNVFLNVNYAKQLGLEVRGVIINGYPQGTNDISARTAPRLIEEYSDAKVLGIVKEVASVELLTPGAMIDTILNSVDVEKIFGIKIPKLNSGV